MTGYNTNVSEENLWRYFRELRTAVEQANQGTQTQPYQHGSFIVSAIAGDSELTISDVSEEDGILIAAELQTLGVRAQLQASVCCPHCQQRVPEQSYCISCRGKL